MRDLILIRSSQMRAHGTVMACDNDPAAAGRLVGRNEIFGADAGFFIFGAQGRGVFVGADTADVEGGVRGEDVLRVRRGSMSLYGVRWEGRERGRSTCAPRVVFCAAPPAMSFALWFWSRSS